MSYHELVERWGIDISRPMLRLALTHRSFAYEHDEPHNERLEFLGDSILGLVTAELLYRNFPDSREGDMSRMKTFAVSEKALASIARELGLGEFLRLGRGEDLSGGRDKDSILSDTVEALIAAVYLDSDYPTCEHITLALLKDDLSALPQTATRLKDAKTQLQEYLQGRGLPLPDYQITEESGPEHAREFQIEATSGDYRATAHGSSRKKAEQQAAAELLKRYKGEKK